MMTLGKYLTNASFKNIPLKKAEEKLYEEWGKKNISYPRTDGKIHAPITILNKDKINKEVKELLELDIEIKYKKKYNEVNEHTIYYIAEQLNLSSPSSLIDNIKKSKYRKKIYTIEDIKDKFNKFKFDKKLDRYIKISEARLKDIIKIKNKKLQKDKFNKIFDKMQKNLSK